MRSEADRTPRMQQIATSLMFVGDHYGKAEEAMELYVALFDDARVLAVERYGPGEAESGIRQARFLLAGREYRVMDSGHGHQFTFTPAISLFVDFGEEARLNAVFAGLSEGGAILMPLQAYDFSARFAWVQDRFGVTWQLNLVADPAPA
jgi:predicted 3-demethylubiquinone-9 3-methyltransferase (glyoxalase superfamily)